MHISASTLAREAAISFRTGRVLSVTTFVVFASVALGAMLQESWQMDRAIHAENRLHRLGGYTMAISWDERTEDIAFTLADCERINSVAGVLAAGGLGRSQNVHSRSAPDHEVGMTDISPTMVDVLVTHSGSQIPPGAAVVGDALLEPLGIADGSVLVTMEEPATRVAVRDVEVLGPGLSQAALRVAPLHRPARACYLALDPSQPTADPSAIRAAFGSADASITSLNPRTDLLPRGSAQLSPHRGAWMAAAVMVGLAFGTLVGWLRRGEQALYATLGVDASVVRAVYAISVWITAVMTGALVAVGGLLVLSIVGHHVVAVRSGFWLSVSCTCLVSFGATVSTLLPVGRPLDQLKDR
jgi:hypothetical protein